MLRGGLLILSLLMVTIILPAQVQEINNTVDTSVVVRKDGLTYRYVLDFHEKFGYRLTLTVSNSDEIISEHSSFLPYPVYRFAVGDIDDDGVDEMFLGVIKSTRSDPVVRKRFFSYTLDSGYIIPLWLGTSIGYELHDFKVIHIEGKAYIQSLEGDSEHGYSMGLYRWGSFGPDRIKYTKKEMTKNEAYKLFFR